MKIQFRMKIQFANVIRETNVQFLKIWEINENIQFRKRKRMKNENVQFRKRKRMKNEKCTVSQTQTN